MHCLDDKAALGLATGTLDAAASAAAREHLDTCDSCRELVASVASEAPAPPPETIGRYQIEKVLGSGAMGIVYEAYDPQLERRVAIKVLRGDAHRDRLLREARAAAQISHANVIAVFDAGIADGEVFMAMELIRGRTLRQWLAERTRSWREVVALAVEAGRGLGAIHAAGLVHRDVKPDNVLVADDGRIVITDLGLVRIEPRAANAASGDAPAGALTQTGALLGTPAYAAPEQLDDATATDARSDQFSFCVMVFEALAGNRPFEAKTVAGLREAIERGATLKVAGVPERACTAIEKGLSADPAKRWPTIDVLVRELAAVLQPKTRGLWIGAGVAAAGALVVTGVLIASMRQSPAAAEAPCRAGRGELARVWNPIVRTQVGAAFSSSKVAYAPSTWRAASELVDDYGARWAVAYDEACAATNIKHVQSPAVLDLRAECLGRRRDELAALLDVLGKADATQIDQASTAIASLTSPSACGDAELLKATEPMPDAPATRDAVTAARKELDRAEASYNSGHVREALDMTTMLSASADKINYAPLVAEVESLRGRIAMDVQEWAIAKTALERGLLAAERGRHHMMRGDIQLRIAYLAMQQDKHEEALAELDKADAVIAGLGGATKNRAYVEDYRGSTLAALGKLDDAKQHLDHAVTLYEEAEGADTIALANPLTSLAFVAYQRGDLPTAIKQLERVLDIQVKTLGPDHPRIGIAHTNLAFNYSAAGKLDDAKKHAEEGRRVLGASLGTGSAPYAEATRALVGIAMKQGDSKGAEKLARDVVANMRKGGDPSRLANALDDLGAALFDQQKLDESLALKRESLAIREKTYPPGHPAIVAGQVDVADVLADLEKLDDALALYTSAKPGADSKDAPPYLAVAVRIGLARCYVETKRAAIALPLAREAIAKNANPDNPDDRLLRVKANFILAQSLAGTGKKADARKAALAAKDEANELGVAPMVKAVDTWLATLK